MLRPHSMMGNPFSSRRTRRLWRRGFPSGRRSILLASTSGIATSDDGRWLRGSTGGAASRVGAGACTTAVGGGSGREVADTDAADGIGGFELGTGEEDRPAMLIAIPTMAI